LSWFKSTLIKTEKIMKYKFIYIILAVFSGLYFVSCSELQSNLPEAPANYFHGEGVFKPQSEQFHGKLVADSPDGLELCKSCHGVDFSGGTTALSCKTANCHPTIDVHQPGIADTTSQNFHGKYMPGINWDILKCASCHNSDYSGGLASPSCLTCHTEENGPEACNTCHGDPGTGGHIFPPKDLEGDTSTTAPGVGAHVAHLVTNNLSGRIRCSNCHIVPESFDAPGHLGTPPADITFGRIAVINHGINSSYDYSTHSCSNTYCHGNFVSKRDTSQYQFIYEDSTGAPSDSMYGNNVTVVWNEVNGAQAKCGSCHGLPPTGHRFQTWPTSCTICHTGVIDAHGNIIDSTKHINGVVNVFGN
jgi:hypothetical protein